MLNLINSLSGTLVSKHADTNLNRLILENQGIEWIIEVSRNSLQRFPNPGSACKVLIFFQHREDAMVLYGFFDELERGLFLELIKVEGVGPRQAIKFLSGMLPDRFIQFLDEGNIDGLESIPGLGRKTAQKLVLALKGKLALDEPQKRQKPAGTEHAGALEDVAQALIAMGYDKKAVYQEIAKLAVELEALSPHDKEKEVMRRVMVALG